MAHKTLTISEEAYEALAALKNEGESFTELVKRITAPLRKKKLSEFAGKIKDEQFAKAALEVRHHSSRFKTNNEELVTKNINHFRRIPGLRYRSW